MLLRFYILVAAIPIVTYCFRQPRSAVWHHSGPEYHKDRKSDNSAWNERFVGHSNGYKVKRVEGHEKDDVGYAHAAAHESEQHALSKAASASKHAAAAAEKGASKHADQASTLGKDINTKAFGFFDYRYKQPEYRVEKFYVDEKQASKYDADHLHHTQKDHENDEHESSGWAEHDRGYLNNAHNSDLHEHGFDQRSDWDNDFHKNYEHSNQKDYSKGQNAYREDDHHHFEPEQPHDHYVEEHHHGWEWAPHEHGYGRGHGWWDGYPEHHDVWGNWQNRWD